MTEEEAWKLWNERIYKPTKVESRGVKPKRSFDELAKIKRCGERKRQGLPCNEKLDTPIEFPGKNNTEALTMEVSVESKHTSIRKWSYGVTTVPGRRDNLLPRTLTSLKLAGFDNPRLFVDGEKDGVSWFKQFGSPVTSREPTIRTFGNWFLGAMELFIREPNADLYAIFQDDFVTYRNLRYYLERCTYPDRGYWNLYTFPSNQQLAPKTVHGGTKEGWYPSNQLGRGAVALVFDKKALLTLFQQQHMVERPSHATRGHRAVDGGIVTALRKVGYSEYVHSPSLVQHTGVVSSMGNQPHLQAVSFRGESFDAMELLGMVEASRNS